MKKLNPLLLLIFLMGSFGISAQSVITGNISDDTGFPLPGASVIIQGTSRGTASDMNGDYSLEIQEGDNVLVYSYIGYVSQEIPIDGQSVIDVVLTTDSEQLDEVVVIGYGEVLKKDLTGSLSSLQPDNDGVSQAQGIENYLQGRAAGVYVNTNGSEPGAPTSIKIRGVNSLTGNTEPLYVVDGIIVNSATEDADDPLSGGNSYLSPQGGLSGINPRDIESIEILKDASATAIYGSRGSNGVILITTKKGKLGEAKFNYSTTTKVGKVVRTIDVLNTDDYIAFQNEYKANLEQNPSFYIYPDGSYAAWETSEEFMLSNSDSIPRLSPINWADDTYRTAVNTNHRLSVSGGGETGNYYIAGGYVSNKGVIPRAYAQQGDFIINLNRNLTDRLKMYTKVSTAFINNSASKGTENLGGSNNNIVRQIISGAPLVGYSENFFGVDYEDFVDGPRAWIQDYDDYSSDFRTLASMKLDYQLNEIFTYRLQFGGDYRIKERQIWYGTSIFRGAQSNGEAGISNLNRFRYNLDNTVLFRKKINKFHRINGTFGFVIDQIYLQKSATQANDFANKDLRADGISYGQVFQPYNFNLEQESILSYLGRINYTIRNRYLFTATYRADGSSKFSKGNRYSHFPSFAFAWKMMEEKFMKRQSILSDAKFRVGWGLTGNQSIPNYRTYTPFGSTANPLPNGNGGALTALVPTNLANPDLRWETTSQYNAGVDFGFFDDRLLGTVDVYYKDITDLLLNVDIGPSTGFSSYYANQGELINKGLEISLNGELIRQKEFSWNAYGNISFNRNRIENLGIPPGSFGTETFSAFLGRQISGGNYFKVPANIFIEGRPSALFWGFETDGIINNDAVLATAPTFRGMAPQLGDVLLVDQNNDGTIDDLDLTVIGDPNPNFNFGLGSQVKFKDLELNMLFSGVYGNEIANANLLREAYAENSSNNIRTVAYENAWRPDNTEGTYPRVGYEIADETGFTDRIVEDASFLRLSYVSLTYTLPEDLIPGIDGLGITLAGQNLWLLTNYSGYDPEVNSFAWDFGRVGIDRNSFPNQRSFSFGLNVDF